MYTKEEKERAIRLYIESGLKIAPVVNTLGYPSPNIMRNWYRRWLKDGRIQGHKGIKFNEQDKTDAIEYWRTHHYSVKGTIQALGYPAMTTLREWIETYASEDDKQACIRESSVIRYTQEQKEKAVTEYIASHEADYKVAARYGISHTTLQGWKKSYFEKGLIESMPKRKKEDLPNDVETLRKEIKDMQDKLYKLQLEYDILQTASRIIKKDLRINLEKMSNPEKADVIDALRVRYPLRDLLNALQIAKSSYYYVRSSRKGIDKYHDIRIQVVKIFTENRSCYGYRRIHAVISRENGAVSEKIIRRIISEEKLRAIPKRARKYSSYKGEITPSVENVLERNFHAEQPNSKWLTDITEFAIPSGKIYLSPIIDCFDGLPVSWTIGLNPNAELVNEMLDIAIESLEEGEHPIVHTDRGCHYRWPGWIERMENAGLTRSMSKKGCSPDNSACEGFFGRIKNEMFYGRNWEGVSLDSFASILNEYLNWYCDDRIKQSLGWKSPTEYRKSIGISIPKRNGNQGLSPQ